MIHKTSFFHSNKLIQKSSLLLTSLLLLLFFTVSSQAQNRKIGMEEFLQGAIMTGLKKDVFPLDLCKFILDNREKYFVGKCPICSPVEYAFNAYKSLGQQKGKCKINNKQSQLLQSKDQLTRHLAFQKLINGYVLQQYKNLKMSKEEIIQMEEQLA